MQVQTQVGPIATTSSIAPGTVAAMRSGNLGDVIVSELHGRFYEQAYRGNLFSASLPLTVLAATHNVATGLSGTLATAATATPIVGIWNPATSTINAIILQATLGVTVTALQSTGAGPFIWAGFAGNSALTLGVSTTVYNRRTLTASGSQCKNMSGVALTGLTNIGVQIATSVMNGGSALNLANLATAVGFPPSAFSALECIDGAIVIPPGGLLALFCNTVTPVAHSAAATLLWEEVPI